MANQADKLNEIKQGLITRGKKRGILTYKEIADSLQISTGTVKQHIHKIYGKLQVSNKTEAINKLKFS